MFFDASFIFGFFKSCLGYRAKTKIVNQHTNQISFFGKFIPFFMILTSKTWTRMSKDFDFISWMRNGKSKLDMFFLKMFHKYFTKISQISFPLSSKALFWYCLIWFVGNSIFFELAIETSCFAFYWWEFRASQKNL